MPNTAESNKEAVLRLSAAFHASHGQFHDVGGKELPADFYGWKEPFIIKFAAFLGDTMDDFLNNAENTSAGDQLDLQYFVECLWPYIRPSHRLYADTLSGMAALTKVAMQAAYAFSNAELEPDDEPKVRVYQGYLQSRITAFRDVYMYQPDLIRDAIDDVYSQLRDLLEN